MFQELRFRNKEESMSYFRLARNSILVEVKNVIIEDDNALLDSCQHLYACRNGAESRVVPDRQNQNNI
jgi:hypothetical protein